MNNNLQNMTNSELKTFIKTHRHDELACHILKIVVHSINSQIPS
ncbi:MAG: DUF6887 family protein, partial [Dolichospermum sp.]